MPACPTAPTASAVGAPRVWAFEVAARAALKGPHTLAGPWAELTITSVGSLKSCCAIWANQGTSALYFLADGSAVLPALHAGSSY